MKILEKLQRDDIIVEFDNEYLDKSWILKSLATLVAGIIVGLLIIICSPFVFLLCIFSDIWNLLLFIFKPLISKYFFKKIKARRINRIMINYQNSLIKDTGLLRLDNFNFYKEILIHDFIFHFLTSYRFDYSTIYTVNDIDLIYCDKNRRRSLGDIFLICKTYYPDCTIVDVLKVLINLLEDNNRKISASRCSNISKYVFHTDSNGYYPKDNVEYGPNLKFQDLIDIYKDGKPK